MVKPYISVEYAEKFSKETVNKLWDEFKTKSVGLTIKDCNKITEFEDIEKPNIEWKKAGFFNAATAKLISNKIEMNINYLYSKDWERFLKGGTINHEVAHIIAFYMFKDHGHGKAWKTIAKMLGDTGNRCHDYARPDNAPKKDYLRLKCLTCGQIFPAVTPKTYEAYKAGKYICVKCKTNMEKALVLEKYIG